MEEVSTSAVLLVCWKREVIVMGHNTAMLDAIAVEEVEIGSNTSYYFQIFLKIK